MDTASELEYLQWAYHTLRQQMKWSTAQQKQFADRFYAERGKKCPFYFPNAVDQRKA